MEKVPRRLDVGWSLVVLFGTAACVLDAVLIAAFSGIEAAGAVVVWEPRLHLFAVGFAIAQAHGGACYLALGRASLWLRGAAWLALCAAAGALDGDDGQADLALSSLGVAALLMWARLRGWDWCDAPAAPSAAQFRVSDLFAVTTYAAVILATMTALSPGDYLPLALVQLALTPLAAGLCLMVLRGAGLLAIFAAYLALAGAPALVFQLAGFRGGEIFLLALCDGAVLLACFALVWLCGYRMVYRPQPPAA